MGNSNLGKIKKIIFATFCLSIACAFLSLISSLLIWLKPGVGVWRLDMLSSLIFPAGLLAVTVILAPFVRSTANGGSPFTSFGVRALKRAAIIIIALEPMQGILLAVLNSLRPITPDGIRITVQISYGGIIVCLGLAVLCLSFIFEYGVYLQGQYDETL